MSQNDRLLAYLKKSRSITDTEARSILAIGRLSARIYDLRGQGIKIKRTMIKLNNRWGEMCWVAQYRIE